MTTLGYVIFTIQWFVALYFTINMFKDAFKLKPYKIERYVCGSFGVLLLIITMATFIYSVILG